MYTVVYSSPVMFGQGLEWEDSTGSECCQANTMEGEGERDKGIFPGRNYSNVHGIWAE